MTRTLSLAAAVALFGVLLLAPAAEAQQINVDIAERLSCNVRMPFKAEAGPGRTLPIALEFSNAGPDRVIRVTVRSNGSVSAAFSVPGGGASTRYMYLTTVGEGLWGPDLFFYDAESGSLLKKENWSGLRSAGLRDMVTVLTIAEGRSPTVSSDFCRPATVQITNATPESLPDRWIGYTAANVIVIPHATWTSPQMDVGPIVDWVSVGGIALIVDAPAGARDEVARTVRERAPFVEARGEALHAGMGLIRFVDADALMQPAFFRGRPSPSTLGNRPARAGSDLRPDLRILSKAPFTPVLLFLVAFSVLVGPVGWWYVVGRRKQPLMYYVLAPVLSVCMIVVVIVVDALKQGFTPRAACLAAELLDQTVQKRVTLSQFCLYCPFTLGLTLRGDYGEQPHMLSAAAATSYGYRGLGAIDARPRAGGIAYGGALPARQKSWYAREAIRMERRRLEIGKEGDKIFVENHLGVPLRHLVVCHQGEYVAFDALNNGQKLAARPMGQKEALAVYSKHIGRGRLGQRWFTGSVAAVTSTGKSPISARWLARFSSGGNAYAALREDALEDLIWLDSARFDPASVSVIWGVY